MERISKISSIDSVTQLLAITLMQMHNEKEQVWQKEIQSIQCEEKKRIRKRSLVAKAYAEKGKIKERPDLN